METRDGYRGIVKTVGGSLVLGENDVGGLRVLVYRFAGTFVRI